MKHNINKSISPNSSNISNRQHSSSLNINRHIFSKNIFNDKNSNLKKFTILMILMLTAILLVGSSIVDLKFDSSDDIVFANQTEGSTHGARLESNWTLDGNFTGYNFTQGDFK